MKPNSSILLRICLLLLLATLIGLPSISCHFRSWPQKRDDNILVPRWADFQKDSNAVFFPEYTVLASKKFVKSKGYPTETWCKFFLFWPDGRCVASAIYDSLTADITPHTCCSSGWYELRDGALHTEFFVGGGSENSYFHTTYQILGGGTKYKFLSIKERMTGSRTPRVTPYLKYKWEEYAIDLVKLPVTENNTVLYVPDWELKHSKSKWD